MVAARVEAIAGLAQISSKEFLRVSWNAAHIAVKATRVFEEMDFVFHLAASKIEAAASNFRGRGL